MFRVFCLLHIMTRATVYVYMQHNLVVTTMSKYFIMILYIWVKFFVIIELMQTYFSIEIMIVPLGRDFIILGLEIHVQIYMYNCFWISGIKRNYCLLP